MREFYMVWVAGHTAPKVLHSDRQKAITEAERLRLEDTTREVYVLAPVHHVPGRALLEIHDGRSCAKQPVEPRPEPVKTVPVVTVKKRRIAKL